MIRDMGWFLGCLAVIAAQVRASAASVPDFSKDVRPILSQHCFKCHGPDDAARKSGLRLDEPEAALLPAKSGRRAITPGKPAESEMLTRVFSTDEDERMPPAGAQNPPTPAEKETLRRWILAGAEYKPHWSFVAPKPPPAPRVKNPAWPRNVVDRFVLSRLEKEGLSPSPPADRLTLARRLHLDLIGMPPTTEEADAFADDSSEDAYERLVDRLLGSPRYGERWARRWMDLARYADTNGYEKDRQRSIWPWRDWVIKALNADMPFDRFTVEQIAGDMLPAANVDQLTATGFHRNTMLNEEGGIDPLEFRFHAMTDRVATTGTTWLGLTVGCAQCHTHKYDPISHREFYQMMAFLNNVDELDLDLPEPGREARETARRAALSKLLAELPAKFPVPGPGTQTSVPSSTRVAQDRAAQDLAGAERLVVLRRHEGLEKAFEKWLAGERARAVTWVPLRPLQATSNKPLLTVQPDHSIFASGDITKNDTYELRYQSSERGITAVRLEAMPDDRLPRHGPGMAYYEGPKGDFFLGEFLLFSGGKPVKIARATHSYAKNHFGKDAGAGMATDGDPQTGWSTAGREGERHEAVFTLAEPLPNGGDLRVQMMFGRHYACSLGRFRISVTTELRGAEARDMPVEIDRLLRLKETELTSTDRSSLREHFLLIAPELAGARSQIDALRKPPAAPTTMIMRERPPENPRATFIHKRGEFLQASEPVEPGVISAIAPFPKDLPRNRLGFAGWLASTNNPLTARVIVNRQWQSFFGQGLVRTTEDFGFQGEMPSHPELLDWLAVEFMRTWSLKRLHRIIVTSATYRQSSRPTPELLGRDSENRLLARGPRVRLDAESIRDAVLRASGLLSTKMGGPSVYPPQPAGVTEVAFGSPAWTASEGEDRYRRSLYTFMKRTAPFALFNTFDGPTGESCMARRDVSNTPLQALTLLNDTLIVQASQSMGQWLASQDTSTEARIRLAFRQCLTRPPTAEEAKELGRFLEAQKKRLSSGLLDANIIAGEGSGHMIERAAWTTLARTILNLDEMITKQ